MKEWVFRVYQGLCKTEQEAQAEFVGDEQAAKPKHVIDIASRIGVADVRAFGLTWEDCEHPPAQLGYSAQVSIVAR